ncbi:MAG: ATP-binding protein [Methylococcaceae bacterium]
MLQKISPEMPKADSRIEEASSPCSRVITEMAAVIDVSETLFRHKKLADLVPEILRTLMRLSGAERAVLILLQEGATKVVMESSSGQEQYHEPPIELDATLQLPVVALRHLISTQVPVWISPESLKEHPVLRNDPYLMAVTVQSGLCLPLTHLGKLGGILYLEHRTSPDVFRENQPQLIEFIALQAAISIDSARLFAKLEEEIQARKRAEYNAHLAYADLSMFSQISAHHLQEPARRLLVYSRRLDSLLHDRLQEEEALLSLNFIHEGANRLRDLVRDIERYLAATEARGLLILQNTRFLLEQVVKRLSSRFQATGATIEIHAVPQIYLDKPRLMEIFEILLENALIHRVPSRIPHIRVSGVRDGSRAQFTVEDNGPGIPEEYRLKVFEVFERLDRNPEAGTGIGLAVVRRIVENRQGSIIIKTSDFGGAAVQIELPDESPSL